MNKNISMSSIYNFFQDLLISKIPVDKGPLEQIPINSKDLDTNKKAQQDILEGNEEEQKKFKGNNSLFGMLIVFPI